MSRFMLVVMSAVATFCLVACGGGDGASANQVLAQGSLASDVGGEGGGARAVAASFTGTATTASTAATTITVRAMGTLLNNVGPQMKIRVNGSVVGQVEVRASAFQDYRFPVAAVPTGAQVDVMFTNDARNSTADRNLYVAAITVNGVSIAPTDAGVTYDRGFGSAAFDGINVIPGQQFMAWAGALRFLAPAEATPPPSPPTATPSPTQFSFPDDSRRVWVHKMIQVPNFVPSTPFGANYPLTLRAKWESPRRPQDTPQLFIGAGITGVQLLWGEGQDASGQFSEALAAYDGLGLELAPCLAIDTVAGGIAMIDSYLAIAKTHPSAAKITIAGVDYYVISIYGSRYGKSAAFWASFKLQAAQNGRKVYLLADAVTAISYHQGKLEPTVIESFAKDNLQTFLSTNVFDAAWTFDDVDLDWKALVNLRLSTTQRFAGGMLPAYNRESSGDGGYEDAQGTARYRRQWLDALSAGLTWNHVVSWNDVSERHDIWPSSEWSYTRSDLTAFYSTLMRQVSWPAVFVTPQLYATVPQRVNLGSAGGTAEALVLNSSKTPVTVQAQLVDGGGMAFGSMVTQTVAPSTAGAASIQLSLPSLPAGRFLRLKATTFDSTGGKLQQVLSAPILVYAAGEQAASYLDTRIKYNSIAARMALPGKVTLAISGTPTSGAATATVTTSSTSASVRFADVLQNTYLANSQLDPTSPVAANIPLVNGRQNMSGVVVNTLSSGFYMGRIIDSNERVGYSDPVYFAAP